MIPSNRSVCSAALVASLSLAIGAAPLAQRMPDRAALERRSDAALVELGDQVRALIEQRILTPSPEAGAYFRSFTDRPRAGMARLLNDQSHDGRRFVDQRGGGSFYSFETLIHDYDHRPDIGLSKWELRSGFAGLDQGFVVDLGERNLWEVVASATEPPEGLSPAELGAWDILWGPVDLVRERESGELASRFGELGIEYESVPAVVGHTYLVRSVLRNEHDVLVLCAVGHRDEYGVTLIWRVLQESYSGRDVGYVPPPVEELADARAEAAPRWARELSIPDLIAFMNELREILHPRLMATSPAVEREHRGLEDDPEGGIARLLQDKLYEHVVHPRGGGAFYDFTGRSNDYDDSPDIKLEGDHYKSGFAGSNLGLILDLGRIPLEELDASGARVPDLVRATQVGAWEFMWLDISSARSDEGTAMRRRTRDQALIVGLDGSSETRRGHTYLVRVVDAGKQDLLAAFTFEDEDQFGHHIAWRVLKHWALD